MRRNKLLILVLALVMVVATATTAMAAYLDTVGHWAERDIKWATDQGYLKGDGNGYFRPEDTVTRAEYVTGVNRLIGNNIKATIGYADVRTGNWYYDEIAKGVYNDIIDNNRYNFGPNEPITRDDAAKIIARAYKLADYAEGATIFTDYGNIHYKGAVGALVVKKVLNGWEDGNYYPGKTLTRAEYAKILRASIENLGLPTKTTPVAKKPSTSVNWDWYYGRDYRYYGYGCATELSNLSSAITRGNAQLPKTGTYTEASLAVLRKAVQDGEKVYDKYKGYRYDSGYYYGYDYVIKPWNYSSFSAFERAIKAEYPGVFTSAQIRDIYNNYRDGYYYGYYGYTINPRSYTTYTQFSKAMESKYPGVFSERQLKAIWDGDYSYYYRDGYYYDRYPYYYYDYCPDGGEITAATKKINDAINALVKIGDPTPIDPCEPEDPCDPGCPEEPVCPVIVKGVEVKPREATIKVKETVKLTATVTPTNATNKNVTWESGDTAVATVDANGLVTGVAEGEAIITVTTEDGGIKATATITVTKAEEDVIKYQPTKRYFTIKKGTEPNPADGVANKEELPAGTEYSFRETEDTTVDIYTPGTYTAVVVITYPDGSFEELAINVTVEE